MGFTVERFGFRVQGLPPKDPQYLDRVSGGYERI